MKYSKLVILTIALIAALACKSQSVKTENQNQANEKAIRDYFEGWVKKDWKLVSSQLANGFTFTSAAPDDHISLETFKSKCWIQSEHIKAVDLVNIVQKENEVFAIVHVITADNKIIRNVEYYKFTNGKIESIEVFFGGNGQGFPTNHKQ